MRTNGQNRALRAAVACIQRIPANDRYLSYVRPRVDELVDAVREGAGGVTVHDFDGSNHLDVEFADTEGNITQVSFRDNGLFHISHYDEDADGWAPAHVAL